MSHSFFNLVDWLHFRSQSEALALAWPLFG